MRPSLGNADIPLRIKPSILDTLVLSLLIATFRRRKQFGVRQWWHRLYGKFSARHRTVAISIHGRKALSAFGNPYPLTTRLYPTYNGPLLELVNATYQLQDRPIRLADIGAAIGDTVLLVGANCAGMISEYICVDGEPIFFEYLKHNLSFMTNVRTICAQLSRATGHCSSLVRTHPGTASALGTEQVETSPLDQLMALNAVGPIDVLKIDVDGFDGEVLSGAAHILQSDRPGIIFEWHPIMCQRTGNSWHAAFTSLREAGYSRFVWFDKFGNFSHFMYHYDPPTIDALARYCLADISADRHFDVVTAHDSSALSLEAISRLAFASSRPLGSYF